jgi:hypothetical protein
MDGEYERIWKEAEELEEATVARQQPVNTLPRQQSRGPSLANGR